MPRKDSEDSGEDERKSQFPTGPKNPGKPLLERIKGHINRFKKIVHDDIEAFKHLDTDEKRTIEIAAVISVLIILIVALLGTGVGFTTQFDKCKAAAQQCAQLKAADPSTDCSVCDLDCTVTIGDTQAQLFSGSVACCHNPAF